MPGGLPAALVLSPSSNLTSLGTGTYTGTVQITGSDASVAYISVSLTVNGGTATGLTVSPNPITFSASLGGATVSEDRFGNQQHRRRVDGDRHGVGADAIDGQRDREANMATTITLSANPSGLTSNSHVGNL